MVKKSDEDFINCNRCHKLFHERCVLHSRSLNVPFICSSCQLATKSLNSRFKLSSENLPTTECDRFITDYLNHSRLEMPKKIIVRLVSCFQRSVEIQHSISKYSNRKGKISYQNCSLFAFFKTAQEDEIAFFAAYFHLYQSDCELEANRNSVYISYIDSVNLLGERQRTKTYQHILLGLFGFLKTKNYRKIFIWSCPPKKSLDYIFHEKPPNMKIPTKQRLIDW